MWNDEVKDASERRPALTAYLATYDAMAQDDPNKSAAYIAGLMLSDPQSLFAELRGNRPILRTAAFTLVTRFKDVQDVLSRSEVFTVRLYAQRMDPVVNGPFMLARDGAPANWREKSIMKTMLRPEDLPTVREMAGRLADASLDACAAAGQIETVSRLGREVPTRMCGEYFGFPGPDLRTMYRWSKATQSDMFKNLTADPEIHAASVEAGQEMLTYLRGLLNEKRKAIASGDESQDIFSRLLRTSFPPELGFDDVRIVANVAGLLIGAVETTSQAIVQVIAQLLGRPEELAAAQAAAHAGDDAKFDGYVWEALRFDPINPLIFRMCESPYVLAAGEEHQATVDPGTVVFAATRSAMFDAIDVVAPNMFNPRRPSYDEFFFGYGEHVCLGKYVALMTIPEVVKRVLLRQNVRLLPGAGGAIDFEGGFFPEKFVVAYGPDVATREDPHV